MLLLLLLVTALMLRDVEVAWKWCYIIRYAQGLLFEMRPLRYVSISYVTLFPLLFFLTLSFCSSFSFSYLNDYLMQHEMTSSRFVSHFICSLFLCCALASFLTCSFTHIHIPFYNSSHIQFIILFPLFFSLVASARTYFGITGDSLKVQKIGVQLVFVFSVKHEGSTYIQNVKGFLFSSFCAVHAAKSLHLQGISLRKCV